MQRKLLGQNTKNFGSKLMNKMFNIFTRLLIIFIVATIIVLMSAAFYLGALWESLKTGEYKFGSHMSLIAYRLALYLLPGIVLFLLGRPEKRFCKSFRCSLLESLNYQFAFYCLIKCVVVILGFDYVANIKVFSAMDSFIIVFGFVATWATKKTTKFSKTGILEKEIIDTGDRLNEKD